MSSARRSPPAGRSTWTIWQRRSMGARSTGRTGTATTTRTGRRRRRATNRSLPDFYDDLAPLAAAELATLKDSDDPALGRLQIEAVTRGAEQIAVTFRDPQRPGCLFGWRWSWAEGPRPEELESAASMLRVNLEEDVLSDGYGLPADCADREITWF